MSNGVTPRHVTPLVTALVTLAPTRPDPTRPVTTQVRASVTSARGHLWNSPNPKTSAKQRARSATFGLGSFA